MTYFFTWAGLMICLAATLASSYVPMGAWNSVTNMAISVAKALLIALFFMHLRHAGALLRIAAITGLVWLALLFGISWTDFGTRSISHAPWSAP